MNEENEKYKNILRSGKGNKETRKFQKRLSLVTTEKCERFFHPLKKKRVLWKKNKHRIKGLGNYKYEC